MVKTNFVPGQRWISDTEANLGLGIVLEIANRRVTLSFPAAAEQRTYAMDNAPVSRVVYQVGDYVNSLDGLHFKVSEVVEDQGCLLYRGYDEEGLLVNLPELELDSFVQFSTPQARLFAGQVDNLQRFNLRVETLAHQRAHQQSSVNGLLGARVQLLPHQIYIANETGRRHAPRVLLADEVGLGKTIEAGLILHQQLVSGRAQRALIVVPDSLVHQWLVEMLRRFNLHFTILDENRCLALADTQLEPDWDDELTMLTDDLHEHEENPFESAQLVLCSLSFLTEHPERQAQAVAAGWDLLLVDEAHHLRWTEEAVSPEYRCVESLAQVAKGLLLLTATPEQLGLESHFARLRLLDPDRYYDLQKFRDEEAQYQPVNQLVEQLLDLLESASSNDGNNAELLAQLTDYVSEQQLTVLAGALKAADVEPLTKAVEQVTSTLLDQHGTGRVLFRNTRSAVTGFPERQLNVYSLPQPEGYAEQVADADLEALITPEWLFATAGNDAWLSIDPRVDWLANWLQEHRTEKVLLICAHASTAIALETHLRLHRGITTAVFHEELDLIARDRAAAYFADAEEGAQVLICSEIGSEGRNFQFSHHLVLFDLPLNPDLLEQRIGRLDRIGQRHTVQIHVPYYEDSAQSVLLRWYDEGLNSFHSACAVGQLVTESFGERLLACLQATSKDDVEALVADTRVLRIEAEQRLQEGRDRLLELNSCNQSEAAELIEQIVVQERGHELNNYMERLLDQFGVEQERHSALSTVLQPGDHMQTSHFPGLPEGGVTVTYQREFALSREDVQFLSWEHPMVSGAMDMVISEQFGNTSVGTVKLGPLKPGTVLLEAIFVMQCAAPASLQLFRYLPCTTVRVLIDRKGTQLGEVLSHDKINKLLKRVPKGTARELVRHAQPELVEMIKKAEGAVSEQQQILISEALERMQLQQGGELQRLESLAKVNPNIRQQEIDLLRDETKSLADYLETAQLKLDALRVIVAT